MAVWEKNGRSSYPGAQAFGRDNPDAEFTLPMPVISLDTPVRDTTEPMSKLLDRKLPANLQGWKRR